MPTSQGSYKRQISEALLSFRIEKALSKDLLLELYLNEIYLGKNCCGVAAASMNYFGKPLENLNLEEVAYLAGLPKAPNHYNPEHRPEAAKERRDWVLGRMQTEGYITAEQAESAIIKPLIVLRPEHRRLPPAKKQH